MNPTKPVWYVIKMPPLITYHDYNQAVNDARAIAASEPGSTFIVAEGKTEITAVVTINQRFI